MSNGMKYKKDSQHNHFSSSLHSPTKNKKENEVKKGICYLAYKEKKLEKKN